MIGLLFKNLYFEKVRDNKTSDEKKDIDKLQKELSNRFIVNDGVKIFLNTI